MSRHALHVWIPTNNRYKSSRNRGRPAPVDGLNEIISSNRTHKYVGASRERQNVVHCAWHIRQAMAKQGYRRMTHEDRCRAMVYMTIVEPHDRRDVPNVVGGATKYALDALTATNDHGAGAIWDDNTKWLKKFVPSIRIDADRPGIEITVIPLEEEKNEA